MNIILTSFSYSVGQSPENDLYFAALANNLVAISAFFHGTMAPTMVLRFPLHLNVLALISVHSNTIEWCKNIGLPNCEAQHLPQCTAICERLSKTRYASRCLTNFWADQLRPRVRQFLRDSCLNLEKFSLDQSESDKTECEFCFNEDLGHLQKTLKYVDVRGPLVKVKSISHLATFRNLYEVEFGSFPITDEDFVAFENLKGLRNLGFSEIPKLTGASFEEVFAECNNIFRITFDRCPQLNKVSGLRHLRFLEEIVFVGGLEVILEETTGFEEFESFPCLASFFIASVTFPSIDDDEDDDVTRNNSNKKAFAFLKRCPLLKSFSVLDCSDPDNHGISEVVAARADSLESLYFAHMKISSIIKSLARTKKLIDITFVNCTGDEENDNDDDEDEDEDDEEQRQFPTWKKGTHKTLKNLDFSTCRGFSDLRFLKHCENIEHISFPSDSNLNFPTFLEKTQDEDETREEDNKTHTPWLHKVRLVNFGALDFSLHHKKIFSALPDSKEGRENVRGIVIEGNMSSEHTLLQSLRERFPLANVSFSTSPQENIDDF